LRTLIYHSIGPVWEVNHAFAATTTTLFTPFMLALAGIVLRGSSFAFRKYAATFARARLFGAIFAGSSLMTPLFFGTVALSGVAPCTCAAETVKTEGPQSHKNQKGQVCRTIASSSSEADSAA
jgi:cytochrome bd-type quinol oxidase subunit 2